MGVRPWKAKSVFNCIVLKELGLEEDNVECEELESEEEETESKPSAAATTSGNSVQFNFLSETPSQPPANEYTQYIKWTNDLSKEMCSIVFDLLSKQAVSDQIQNELVELLGFENIELTEYLISHREKVVKAYTSQCVDQPPRRKQVNVLDASEPNNLRQQSKVSGKFIFLWPELSSNPICTEAISSCLERKNYVIFTFQTSKDYV